MANDFSAPLRKNIELGSSTNDAYWDLVNNSILIF